MHGGRVAVLCICCVLAVLLADAAAASPSRCMSKQVTFHVLAQGENQTAAIDFLATNRGSTCRLTGEASLTIVQSGRRFSGVRGNPIRARIDVVIRPGQTSIVIANWANWCGSRTNLRIRGAVGKRVTTARLLSLPVCLYPKHPSRLAKV